MEWTKGSRCGIDNCASRFYRVINGRRVCQNNHIQEGLETTGDDDDFVAVGQRIRQPRSQGSKSAYSKGIYQATTLRGAEAKRLIWECMQIVFQNQMRCVMTKCSLTADFEENCRELWACFLTVYATEKLTLSHLVCLVYLATRRSNDQVLLGDFNLWIRVSQFPYLETYKLLPPEKFRKLPSDLRKHFIPSSGPGRLRLHEQTVHIKKRLAKKFHHLRFHEIDPKYVCSRLCRDLLFPPVIYFGALSIYERYLTAQNPSNVHGGPMFEEIPAICSIIVSAKLYFGFDDPEANSVTYHDRLGFDVGLWEDLVRKLWILNPEIGRADERLAHTWTGDQIDDYLAWYSKHLTSTSHDKRIKSFFPVPKIRETIQDSYPSQEVLSELCEVLYATLPGETLKPGVPGSVYKIYSQRSRDVPSTILLLYEVMEKFLNTDSEFMRTIIRGFEIRVRSQFSTVKKRVIP